MGLAYGTMVKPFIMHLILFISFLTFNHPYYSIKSIKFFFFFCLVRYDHFRVASVNMFVYPFIHSSFLFIAFFRAFVRSVSACTRKDSEM